MTFYYSIIQDQRLKIQEQNLLRLQRDPASTNQLPLPRRVGRLGLPREIVPLNDVLATEPLVTAVHTATLAEGAETEVIMSSVLKKDASDDSLITSIPTSPMSKVRR